MLLPIDNYLGKAIADEVNDPVRFGCYIQLLNIGQQEADKQFVEISLSATEPSSRVHTANAPIYLALRYSVLHHKTNRQRPNQTWVAFHALCCALQALQASSFKPFHMLRNSNSASCASSVYARA